MCKKHVYLLDVSYIISIWHVFILFCDFSLYFFIIPKFCFAKSLQGQKYSINLQFHSGVRMINVIMNFLLWIYKVIHLILTNLCQTWCNRVSHYLVPKTTWGKQYYIHCDNYHKILIMKQWSLICENSSIETFKCLKWLLQIYNMSISLICQTCVIYWYMMYILQGIFYKTTQNLSNQMSKLILTKLHLF